MLTEDQYVEPDFRKRTYRIKDPKVFDKEADSYDVLIETYLPEFNTTIGLWYPMTVKTKAAADAVLAHWQAQEDKRYSNAMEYYKRTRK